MGHKTYEILQEIAKGNGMVLSTVVKVEGSSYRKQGAMMLFTKDNKHVGMLSAGCLEEDASIRAKQLIESKQESALIVYDMSSENDLGWGRGTGCQGKIHVLLEKVTAKMCAQFKKVHSLLQRGISVQAIKNLEHVPDEIQTIYEAENGTSFGEINFPEHGECYVQYFTPRQRLIIFGAGADVPPLTRIAVQAGFEVFVWDWREALLLSTEHLPNVQFFPDWRTFTYAPADMLIIMTHDFIRDQEIVQFLMKQPQTKYLGILGPKRRTKRLLRSSTIPEFIHSPIGMKIGAEGAEEIAVSIMAEVISIMRGVGIEKGGSNLFGSGTEQTIWQGQ